MSNLPAVNASIDELERAGADRTLPHIARQDRQGRPARSRQPAAQERPAGLSAMYIFKIPPCFCADAGSGAIKATRNAAAAARAQIFRFIYRPPKLLVEPDVFHAPAVVDAVGHQRQPLDPGLPAGASGRVVEDRPDPRLGEDALDR